MHITTSDYRWLLFNAEQAVPYLFRVLVPQEVVAAELAAAGAPGAATRGPASEVAAQQQAVAAETILLGLIEALKRSKARSSVQGALGRGLPSAGQGPAGSTTPGPPSAAGGMGSREQRTPGFHPRTPTTPGLGLAADMHMAAFWQAARESLPHLLLLAQPSSNPDLRGLALRILAALCDLDASALLQPLAGGMGSAGGQQGQAGDAGGSEGLHPIVSALVGLLGLPGRAGQVSSQGLSMPCC